MPSLSPVTQLRHILISTGMELCAECAALLEVAINDANGPQRLADELLRRAGSRTTLVRIAGDRAREWVAAKVRHAKRSTASDYSDAIVRHSKLYSTLHARADAAGLTDREELDRRIAICYRCPHTDGLGCAEYGCSNNASILSRWRSIVLDPQQHCPIYGAEVW